MFDFPSTDDLDRPGDRVRAFGLSAAALINGWALYAVGAQASDARWPLSSWVVAIPAWDEPGPLWLELLPVAWFWVLFVVLYVHARRKERARPAATGDAVTGAVIGAGIVFVVAAVELLREWVLR